MAERAAAAGAGGRLRVLALHAHRTSAEVLRRQLQLARFAHQFPAVELHFLDAPHAASGAPDPLVTRLMPEGPFFEWWDRRDDAAGGGGCTYHGLDATLEHVAACCRAHGPFDGVLGFSQGAICAGVLLAVAHAAEAERAPPGLDRFRFAILYSGMRARDPAVLGLYDQPLRVPTVHLWGDREDPAFAAECAKLAGAFQDPLVLSHPRGHVVPALDEDQRAAVQAFLDRQLPTNVASSL